MRVGCPRWSPANLRAALPDPLPVHGVVRRIQPRRRRGIQLLQQLLDQHDGLRAVVAPLAEDDWGGCMLVVDHAIEQVGAVATGGVRDYAHAGRGGCQAEGDLHLADFVHGAGLQRGPMEKFTSPVTGWWGAGFFYRRSEEHTPELQSLIRTS